MSDKQRTGSAHPLEVYTFTNYLAYIFYPPLYIAGPILTFNDFMWQVGGFSIAFHCPTQPISSLQMGRKNLLTRSSIVAYAIRFLLCLLTMEFVLHYMYMVAIKDTKAWDGFSAAEISMVGFWNLIIVWLKV